MSHPPPPTPSPAQPSPAGSDPVFQAVDGLVRDGTLDHEQADRVYAAVRDLPLRDERPVGWATSSTPPAAGTLVQRLLGAAALTGSAVAVACSVLSAFVAAEYEEGFDWEAFLVVTGVAVTLAALVAGVTVLARDREHARWLTAGPAALAAVALGLVVVVGLLEEDAVDYVSGGVVLLAGAGLYAVLRTSPPLVAAVLGGLVVVSALLDDTAPDSADGGGLAIGAVLVLYGVAVAGLGWLLPTRHVTAPVGGAIAIGGTLVVFYIGLISVAFSGLSGDAPVDTTGDTATALALGVVVCLGLFGLYGLTGLARYAAVATAGTLAVVSLGVYALDLDNTLRWTAGVAALGAAVALGAGVLVLRGVPRRG